MSGGPYWGSQSRAYTQRKDPADEGEHWAEMNELRWKYVTEPYDEVIGSEWYRNRYGNLPVEKLRGVMEIDRAFERLTEKRISEVGTANEGDQEKRRVQLSKDRQAEIAKLLTPAE